MAFGFVSPADLSERREEVTVVDVRQPWEYEAGHVPGAVSVPFERVRDPTDGAPGKLPTRADFETTFGQAGIGADDTLVAYDGEFGVYASRVLLTAAVYGHDPESLALLDGDYTAWERSYETTATVPSVDAVRYEPERSGAAPSISASELEAALETDAVVVDTRAPVAYDTVHVDGAVNFQWRTLVDEDERRMKPDPRCVEILSEHGLTFDRPIRLYCNTARRLSFVYAVLRTLGHDDVGVYEGGIDAWAEYGGVVETSA